jgi:acyl-[acyl-carrier-protein] desaturase
LHAGLCARVFEERIPVVQSTQPDDPAIRSILFKLYREFFDRAEKKRRWSLQDDIPWNQCNPSLSPALADVVESFCAVELYLPDYISKALPLIRGNRGWAWFHANWGYEESKHSLALGDWLLRSGHRTEEQMADLEGQVFAQEWNLPQDSAQGMVVYAMVQELATWIHYRNLRECVQVEGGDPALCRLLDLIGIDERSHHAFYRRVVQLFLELDRPGILEQLRRVLHSFAMPALHLLADSRQRVAQVKALRIFTEETYVGEVYEPILEALGVQRRELRRFGLSPK